MVYRNTSTPGNFTNAFASPISLPTGADPEGLVTVDIDGDGKPDVAIANQGDNTISLLRNTSIPGTISFASQVVYTVTGYIQTIATSDFDGDGKPYLALADDDTTIAVFRNTATPGVINAGSLAAQKNFVAGLYTLNNIAGDVDGDGKADMINFSGNDATISVLRNDPLLLSTILGDSSVCVGDTITLSDEATGGTWSSGNTAIATVGSTGVVIGVGWGVVIISYQTSSTTAMIHVTVNPQPNAGVVNGVAIVCLGSMASLSDTASGGVWSSNNTNILVDGSGNVTGSTVGTTTISYTVTNGCGIANATETVSVIALPYAGSITGSTNVCVGSTVNLTDATSGGVWSSGLTGVASVGTNGVVTGMGSGTTTISYAVTNGCGSAYATAVVNVTALPNAGSITGTTNVCVGSIINLTDAASGGVWSSGSTGIASVGTSGVVTGIGGGTVVISYTVGNSCGVAYAMKTVSVMALPNAGTITGTTNVCVGLTINLTDGTGGGLWTSGSTGIAVVGTNGVVTGMASGSAVISYTVTNGCGSASATELVTVNGIPGAGTISGPNTVCAGGATITLADFTGGGLWSSGSTGVATVGSAGLVTGVASGTAIISYMVSNSCGTAYATKTVTVTALPNAGSINGGPIVCLGTPISLSDAVTGGVWSSGSTGIAVVGSTGVVTGVTSGTVLISYTVTNSCGSASATKMLTVNALPVAGTINGAGGVCASGTLLLSDASGGGVWSSGATGVATVGTNGLVTALSEGIVIISYTVSNSCGVANASAIVTVNATFPTSVKLIIK